MCVQGNGGLEAWGLGLAWRLAIRLGGLQQGMQHVKGGPFSSRPCRSLVHTGTPYVPSCHQMQQEAGGTSKKSSLYENQGGHLVHARGCATTVFEIQ
jgi:hypothetical protein